MDKTDIGAQAGENACGRHEMVLASAAGAV